MAADAEHVLEEAFVLLDQFLSTIVFGLLRFLEIAVGTIFVAIGIADIVIGTSHITIRIVAIFIIGRLILRINVLGIAFLGIPVSHITFIRITFLLVVFRLTLGITSLWISFIRHHGHRLFGRIFGLRSGNFGRLLRLGSFIGEKRGRLGGQFGLALSTTFLGCCNFSCGLVGRFGSLLAACRFLLGACLGRIGNLWLAATFLWRILFERTLCLQDLRDTIIQIVIVRVGNVERLNESYNLLRLHIIQFFCGMHSNIIIGNNQREKRGMHN